MPLFKEKDDKLSLPLADSGVVKIKIDCLNGTIVKARFHFNDFKSLECGQTVEIGSSAGLKNKSIKVKGSAQNPDRDKIKIQHTVFDESGNSVSYTFPDDYTGSPEYANPPNNIDYEFKINMR
jgi:hypothetical protein